MNVFITILKYGSGVLHFRGGGIPEVNLTRDALRPLPQYSSQAQNSENGYLLQNILQVFFIKIIQRLRL